jgi:hypothetical protein
MLCSGTRLQLQEGRGFAPKILQRKLSDSDRFFDFYCHIIRDKISDSALKNTHDWVLTGMMCFFNFVSSK